MLVVFTHALAISDCYSCIPCRAWAKYADMQACTQATRVFAGVYRQGSNNELSALQLRECIDNATQRRSSLLELLQQTVSGE